MPIIAKEEEPKPIARSIYVPGKNAWIFERAAEIGENLGINMNTAIIQGLELWIDKHEYDSARKTKLSLTRQLRSLEHDLSIAIKKNDKKMRESLGYKIKLSKALMRQCERQIAKYENTQESKSLEIVKNMIRSITENLPDLVLDEIKDSPIEDEFIESARDKFTKELEEDIDSYYSDMAEPPF